VPPLLFITSATSICDQSPQVPDQVLAAGRQHTAHLRGLQAVLDRAANLAMGELNVANLAKVKVFVQAKRYKQGTKITANTVKQLR